MNIKTYLAEEIANILGVPVDSVIDSDFDDLGLSSVNMTEIVERLSLTFPHLPITILYEYKNLQALSEYLQSNYSEIVKELFQEISPHLNLDKSISNKPESSDIAIIGMAGYFPGAKNLDEFWELLLAGQSAISEVPIERWDMNIFYSPDETKSGYSYSKWGAFLTDVDKFDPLVFNISPRDAAKIDPQERLFLQASYTALEDSGYITLLNETNPAKVGVFVGVTNASYGWLENDHDAWRHIKHVNVSSAYWSVANRVSYTFNFSGPSLSVDTACSSSLTALHLACDSLRRGECAYSIVGGVNLILHPRQYTELSDMKMLSRGNQNKTFSDTADGFVYGEGIISLVLKPLQNAVNDHDRIYAVIKSTSVNANGKTSGYTVPSPNAQASLISDAIAKSGYSASDVQYVECHGTGTKLGDPIEIRGLTKAFKCTDNQQPYCLLGSVKANIGHLESAAGLAGVVKAALQIANKRISPNVLVEPLNKKIDFNSTPFKLVKEPQSWPNEHAPLLTCVSSFGAGGANAHVILSNNPIPPRLEIQQNDSDAYLLAISANHPNSLRRKLEELYSWLQSNPKDLHLGDMVYSLNNHRLHYSQRMSFIFSNKETLEKQVLDVIVNEIPLNYYSNSFSEHKPTQEFSLSELSSLIDAGLSDKTLHHLAIAYVNGVEINWNELYKKESYQLIKVPYYPFLQERCWITDEFLNNVEQESDTQHPFITEVHQEPKQCLKMFTGQHYAFAEHVLKGEKIFPGVCHLEMVHAAFRQIYQTNAGVISEITWLAPMNLIDDRCEAKLQFIENGSVISYQLSKLVNGEFLLCSQGKISSAKEDSTLLDLSSFKVNLTEKMDGSELYHLFREKGWYHGPAFQSVNHLYFNDERLVAEIQLPDFFTGHNELYGLNPGIMDGILQAITILNMRVSTSNSIALPFYLNSLQIIKPIAEKVYALVTIAENKRKQRNKFFDVVVTDLDGSVCLKLSGFTMAMVQEKSSQNPINYYSYNLLQSTIFDRRTTETAPKVRILIVYSQNDDVGYSTPSDMLIVLQEKKLRVFGQDRPFNIEDKEDCLSLIQDLKSKGQDCHLLNLVDMGGSVYGELSALVHSYLGFIQRLLKARLVLKYIFSCEFSNKHSLGSLGACLPGFYKSLHAEIPGIRACHLIIDKQYRNNSDLKTQISAVFNHYYHCPELHLTPEGFKYLHLVPNKSFEPKLYFKRDAVYLIAGGLGGIGRKLTQYLTQEFAAKVIILGRSALDEEKTRFLARCKLAYYYQVDIGNQSNLEACYQRIKADFPHINGVFNLVALSKDDYFLQQDLQSFEATCATKIKSTLNLDGLLANESLDFFVLFSSIASVLGNRGQTDYAAANAWFDRFALHRNDYVANNARQGITVSINWPFIEEGGFQLDAAYLSWMKEHWGMLPMSITQCLSAISAALSCGTHQVMPFVGNEEQLLAFYNKNCLPAESAPAETINTESSINPYQNSTDMTHIVNEIKKIIATHQKIKIEDLNVETALTEYGYSSISFTELSTLINEQFSVSTTPAIFFDATCIEELCELLIEDYPEVFAANSVNTPTIAEQETNNAAELKGVNGFDEPIAIIGYHARFPGAKSADEYWSNLEAGVSSISEIPAERWRWQDVYGDPEQGDFTRSKWGGFITDIDKFDARFFGISPREAELMDPQQRIFLESVYHAMEHSGYTKQIFSEQKTGLYVGVSLFEYGKLLQQYADIDAYTSSGTVHSIVANRVSYILGLTGPSIALDTACSSSLVAVHEAVKALRYGDCELAIAGGVNALIEPSFYIAFDKAGMLSPDGKCNTFDKSANGYVRGEGVATLILKPLSKALRDNDTVYGLVKGSGINHGGHAQTMTSPNPNAQAELIIDTFQKAKVPFNTVQYVECHGTGTPLGDPVEVNGLKKAYQVLKQHHIELQHKTKCGIGSVKTNIGHLESAAGVAGILKVLLMMRNKKLVKTINFTHLNPYIDVGNTPFYVVDQNTPWDENKTSTGQVVPIRAAVSGFGFGGANAHIILEMPPINTQIRKKTKPFYLITLSAVQEEVLQRKIQELADWLQKQDNSQHDAIESISFTLNQGREHFKYKFSCVVTSQQELLNIVTDYLENRKAAQVFMGTSDSQHKLSANEIYQQLLTQCAFPYAYKELLLTLAQNYIQGMKIDWMQLHREESNGRIALPVYPFEKKAYWFTKKIDHPKSLADSGQSDEQLSHYCYAAQWEKIPLHFLATPSNAKNAQLVVYFDKEVQGIFEHSFPANVEQFVILDNEKNDVPRCYGVEKSDVFSYLEAISSIDTMDVIYFICPKKTLEDDLSHEYLTIFYRFIKSMIQAKYDQKNSTIKVITFGITNPTGDEHKLSAGAGIQGFAKTLANEFLEWQVEQFDFPIDTTRLPPEVHHVMNSSGNLCLYRNGEWYRQKLLPKKLDHSVQGSAFKKMGTYLIIGGMGGIGRVLADYLTVHYNATVILVGRRAPQEIDEKYQHQYVQCDISQEQSVCLLYEHLQKTHQHIDGLFHCAMVLKDQSIRQMSESNLNKALNPKSRGTYHLLNIMGALVRDFIAIFSSTETYFALAGQSNYTAASWLQDQVAESFYRQQNNIKLIHWGLWEEAGAVSDEQYQKALHQLGFVGIKNKDAMKLLESALLSSHFDVALLGLNHHAQTLYPILNLEKDPVNPHISDSRYDSTVFSRLNETTQKQDPLLVLNQHAIHLLWAVFNKMNLWTDANHIVTHQQLLHLTNASRQSSNMLQACLSHLEKSQFISYQAASNGYSSTGNKIQQLEQVIQHTRHAILQYPELKPFLEALIITTTHLFELLKGSVTATELICPDGDLSLLKSFYSNNPIVNPINLLLAKKVEEVVRAKLVTSKVIRIIEIGAGCGGTTEAVLKVLKDKNQYIEYLFTDISPAFINRARDYFSDYANIQFQLLDIESEDVIQGTYDVLIASNVLHATKDIKHAMNNCKRFLTNNGTVIINEVTKDESFLTLIFGIFSGWWAYQDSCRMLNSPLISEDHWKLQLSEIGFKDIELVKATAADPHTLIYAVNSQDTISTSFNSLTCESKETDRVDQNNDIKYEKIITILAKVLKFPESEINQYMSFADLGLDSITGVSFISKINKEFETNLPVNIIFSHKNIVELGEKIKTRNTSQPLSENKLSPVLLFEE